MPRVHKIVLLIVLGCSRVEPGHSARLDGTPTDASAPRAIVPIVASIDAGGTQRSRVVLPELLRSDGSIDDTKLDALMDRMYGDAARRDDTNAPVIRFVEAYVNKNHSNFSKDRRFVAFNKDGGWVVDLINVRSLIEGGRDGDLEFRISVKSGGFKVDSIHAR